MCLVMAANRILFGGAGSGSVGLAEWVLGFVRKARARTAAPRQMLLLETLALGGRRQVQLIRCGDERFLIAGGTDCVNAIVRVDAGVGVTHALEELV
jgi:flagellar biogenesis protein FliO